MTGTSPNPEPTTCPRLVLLAAGASTRLGFPKALAPLPLGTPLERLLRESKGLFDKPPLVVAGAHHFEISQVLTGQAQLLCNPFWPQGRSGSLQVAIRSAQGEHLLVAPVDCPRVPRAVFEALLTAWRSHNEPPSGWLAPFWLDPQSGQKRFGHPILMGRDCAQKLLSMPPETPLRELRAQNTPWLQVEVFHREILEDLDTPWDFERLSQRDQDRL